MLESWSVHGKPIRVSLYSANARTPENGWSKHGPQLLAVTAISQLRYAIYFLNNSQPDSLQKRATDELALMRAF